MHSTFTSGACSTGPDSTRSIRTPRCAKNFSARCLSRSAFREHCCPESPASGRGLWTPLCIRFDFDVVFVSTFGGLSIMSSTSCGGICRARPCNFQLCNVCYLRTATRISYQHFGRRGDSPAHRMPGATMGSRSGGGAARSRPNRERRVTGVLIDRGCGKGSAGVCARRILARASACRTAAGLLDGGGLKLHNVP